MYEVDEAAFAATAKWCVYFHSRPDGSVFYVGKGLRRRAVDFAPSRRTQHHKNIVAKYGRDKINVRVIPCAYEAEANMLERVHIKMNRYVGHMLVNITNGGEGASGRPMTEKQRANLAIGRGAVAYAGLTDGAKKHILDGLERGRGKWKLWAKSPAGQAHIRTLAEIGRKVLHQERVVRCAQCWDIFKTCSAKAKCCSRLCEQRHRRAAHC